MKTFWFQLLGLTILILGATFLAFNQKYVLPLTKIFKSPGPAQQTAAAKTDSLTIIGTDGSSKAELLIELADNKEKRSKGLGYRDSLASGSGMLFIHENTQKYTYWMKGMEFPIDIIWILNDTIVDMIPNVPPPITGQTEDTLERYSPTVEVNRVLETNAGFAAKNGIGKGDKIKLTTE